MFNPAIDPDTPSPARPGLTVTPTALRTQAASLRFTTVLLCVCLFQQRFGVPAGAAPFSIVGRIGLGLDGWGMARPGAAWHGMSHGAFDAAPGTDSLLHFLGITALAVPSFAVPVGAAAFFARINRLLAIVAGLRIAPLAPSFVSLRPSAFTGSVPAKFQLKQGCNQQALPGTGATRASDGLFLVEPSVMFQFMALALQGALFVPLLLFLFTGGYQQFPPVLLAVARLRPTVLAASVR